MGGAAPAVRSTGACGGGGTLVVVGRKHWAYGVRIDAFLEDRLILSRGSFDPFFQ